VAGSAYALWAEAVEVIQKFGVMVKAPTGFSNLVDQRFRESPLKISEKRQGF
jgi:hypothetical protein